jgi:glycosyltransferase involved in cell wall biosynthesis
MHICLISVEIFAWGKYGGFGRATRTIGRELVKQNVQVTAIVPRRMGQAKIEMLDGIKVIGFDLKNPVEMFKIYRDCDADIFHSEEPSFGTFLARVFHPEKKHVVTFRDTRLIADWLTEFHLPSLNKLQVLLNWFYEDNFLVHHAVRIANRRFVAAHLLARRARAKYLLDTDPEFLPTPVEITDQIIKEKSPTVIYVGRWDRRKRLEIVIELARKFPQVHFIITGNSRDKAYDQKLRAAMKDIPNIEVTGFINQFENDEIKNLLSRSWILVNTAAREGLPNSFIEACANKCAILSSVDPDGFSSRFGVFVKDDDFEKGLKKLLENDLWKKMGEAGCEYVAKIFSQDISIEKHMQIYSELLNNKGNLTSK